MLEKYFINGWEYGRSYFLSLGRFTENEREELNAGKIIRKRGNEFWIIKER